MNNTKNIYEVVVIFYVANNWPMLISAGIWSDQMIIGNLNSDQFKESINIEEPVTHRLHEEIYATIKLEANSSEDAIKKAKIMLLSELISNKQNILEEGD